MLSYKTIDPHTLELLKKLTAIPEFSNLRLVGGTSLALQYGHRNSIDIDLFGKISISNEDLRQKLMNIGGLQVIKESDNIKIYQLDNVKVDIVNYAYEWIDAPLKEDGLVLATPKDIAAMKINAIEGRGTKKDFIDLNELLKHYKLEEILHFYQKKYPEASIFRALMSLAYMDDADKQPMPRMFIPDKWDDIKKNILLIVKNYSKQ